MDSVYRLINFIFYLLEVEVGVEPTSTSFAGCSLTIGVPYHGGGPDIIVGRPPVAPLHISNQGRYAQPLIFFKIDRPSYRYQR